MELILRRPDDWHAHFRDGAVLPQVVATTAAHFARAVAMPNLQPPVTSCEEALAYRRRILDAAPEGFDVFATLYLTDRTTVEEIEAAARAREIVGVKLYPAGATTHSDAGVRDLGARDDVFEAMAKAGLPLMVHGEVTTAGVDVFDREKRFLDDVLGPLLERHSGLRVVLEHITTAAAVGFVRGHDARVGATITAHHLLCDRNDMLVGGIRPHFYCLPVLKRSTDREALLDAATGDDDRFFLGTDSAPHARGDKEAACGCAGCYTAPVAMPLYAMAFEERDALDRLEDFASVRGARFYGQSLNESSLRLRREPWSVPTESAFGASTVVPFFAGREVPWRVVED